MAKPSGSGASASTSATYQAAAAPTSRTGSGRGRSRRTLRRREAAAIGEAGIEPGHLQRRDGGAAQRNAERIARCRPAAGPARRRPCAGSTRKRCGPDLLQRQHGRHVQRLLQRAAHGDGALMIAVEIARQPVAEAHRHVLDQRFRMQGAIVEGHGVDQRLQRRAGRAMGAHQVDLAGAAEEIARRPARPRRRRCGCRSPPWRSAAGRRSGRAPRATSWASADCSSQADGGRDDRARRLAGQPGREMRRVHRHGQPLRRHRPARSPCRTARWSITPCSQPARQHARRARPAPRPARGRAGAARRLRDGDQQRRLGGAELPRLLAEVGEGGGAHALEIAAHRRQRQVDRQHLALGVAPFELQRARRLDRPC